MAYTILQGGTTLQYMSTAGVITSLVLPQNITLSSAKVPRFTVFNRYAVMVNSPSRPLAINASGIVYPLTPLPPTKKANLQGASGGSLSGTFQAAQTFRFTDAAGNTITESDYGPIADAATISGQYLLIQNMGLSNDLVLSTPNKAPNTELYRTVTLGTTFFKWTEITGNTQTSYQDDLADASLSLVAAPVLGSAPDLTLIATWRDRLWGVDRKVIDDLRYTEAGTMYAWAADNAIEVAPVGGDSRGITGLIPRREMLGVGRRNRIRAVTGTSNDDFRIVDVASSIGIESPDTVAVYNDTSFWLWKDGVYQWNSDGISCVSDGANGRGMVRSWFATDSYFNRSRFQYAFAQVIPDRHVYRLFLCSAGSLVIDRFVDYDYQTGTWWGPHKTGAFTPVSAVTVTDANDKAYPMVGGSGGYFWKEQTTRTDDTATAIDFSVDTVRHIGGSPNIDKQFERLQVAGVAQSSGALVVTPSVGELAAPAATQALQMDLTQSSATVGRVAPSGVVGKACALNFREATPGQDVELLGYELPYHDVGQR